MEAELKSNSRRKKKGSKRFTVWVDDNFQYMDESERYKQGEYDILEEAIAACKKVVETSVVYKPGATADDLYGEYIMFGEEPFIEGDTEFDTFNARKYAKEYFQNLCQGNNLN